MSIFTIERGTLKTPRGQLVLEIGGGQLIEASVWRDGLRRWYFEAVELLFHIGDPAMCNMPLRGQIWVDGRIYQGNVIIREYGYTDNNEPYMHFTGMGEPSVLILT